LRSFDNLAFDVIDDEPKVFIQEDLGSESALSQILEYDVATGDVEEIGAFKPDLFYKGGSAFMTANEESSGIISLKNILGEGYFALSCQAHTTMGLSDSDSLVEHGQLVIMNLAVDRSSDLIRTKIIESGDMWNFRVDGLDPGAAWNDVGVTVEDPWNTNTSGFALGESPTPIGYGEGEGVLATNVGQPEAPRPAGYFFRKEFDLELPDQVIGMELIMLIDDGAVVYLNGVEVSRYNFNFDSEISFDSYASAQEGAEKDWKIIPFVNHNDLTLQETGNVLAISVHQGKQV
jgi:hypothetical protein